MADATVTCKTACTKLAVMYYPLHEAVLSAFASLYKQFMRKFTVKAVFPHLNKDANTAILFLLHNIIYDLRPILELTCTEALMR